MNNNINMINKFPGYSYIEITNNAGYVVRFSVTYTFKGKATTHKSSEFTLLQSDKIYIPNDAILVALKVEEEAFIGKWVAFYVQFFFKPITKCYSVTGTILNPKAVEVPCYEHYFKNCVEKKSKNKFTDYIRC